MLIDLFTDGSVEKWGGTTPSAAWSVVVCHRGTDKLKALAMGLVWAPLQQTSGVAEWVGRQST